MFGKDREERYWQLLDKLNDRIGSVEQTGASIFTAVEAIKNDLDHIRHDMDNVSSNCEDSGANKVAIESTDKKLQKIESDITWFNRSLIGLSVTVICSLLGTIYVGVAKQPQPSSNNNRHSDNFMVVGELPQSRICWTHHTYRGCA